MIRRPPRSTLSSSSAASDVYKRQLINMENKPIWSKKIRTDIKAGCGSFDNWSGMAKVQAGTYNFQSITKAWFMSSENNFPFLNINAIPEPEMQNRKNGSGSQKLSLIHISEPT